MTQSSNSDLLRAGYDAWNRQDVDAWIDRLHPNIRIQTSGVFPDLAPEYVGCEAARKFWGQMHEPWETFQIGVEHVEDDGDWAIASIRFRGRGADSGVEVDMRFGMAMRVQDGMAIELVNRRTFDEARMVLERPKQKADRTPT